MFSLKEVRDIVPSGQLIKTITLNSSSIILELINYFQKGIYKHNLKQIKSLKVLL